MSEQVAGAQGDTEQVRAKLKACEEAISLAETGLRSISLQAALSEDPYAGHDTVARLNQLRGKRELLVNALAAAEQAEVEREAALHTREWQARKRSLAQKAGQLERDAQEVARLIEALHQARNRMAETGQGIVALLPSSLRTNARPYPAMLATRTLRELCSLESWRLDQDAPKPKLLLTSYWPNFEDAATGRISPLTELVGQLCASLKSAFDNTAPAPSKDLVPAQTTQPTQPTQPAQDEEESASQFCEQVAKEGALTNE